jgi:hypothetical protein
MHGGLVAFSTFHLQRGYQVIYSSSHNHMRLADKELQPEEMDAISSLQTQFKRWQQSFAPYTTFCNDNLC